MLPMRPHPPIRERGGEVEEGKERFTAKDLTRKQVLLYIFEDFFKGSFIFLSLFLDGLVVAFLYQEPFLTDLSPRLDPLLGFPIYSVYLVLLSVLIDSFLIYFEIKYYVKLFGDEAVKKRYMRKEDQKSKTE